MFVLFCLIDRHCHWIALIAIFVWTGLDPLASLDITETPTCASCHLPCTPCPVVPDWRHSNPVLAVDLVSRSQVDAIALNRPCSAAMTLSSSRSANLTLTSGRFAHCPWPTDNLPPWPWPADELPFALTSRRFCHWPWPADNLPICPCPCVAPLGACPWGCRPMAMARRWPWWWHHDHWLNIRLWTGLLPRDHCDVGQWCRPP